MTTPQLLLFIVCPLLAYLLGAIHFALLIGLANGVDIRKTGSGNVGATNLGRTLGVRFFWYAFLGDFLKGFLPTLSASLLLHHFNTPIAPPVLPLWAPLLTAAAAILGHLFSPYLKFKGGKGVATSFGAVLGIWPLLTLAGLGAGFIFLLVFFGWRYISLASIVAAVAFPTLIATFGSYDNPYLPTYLPLQARTPLLILSSLLALMVLYKHRSNIKRLLAGTEPHWHEKK